MNQEKQTNPRSHNITMEGRKLLSVSGVQQVERFDEHVVILHTDMGQLTIKGQELHLDRLNTESGDVGITGSIYGMMYTNEGMKGGFFSRILK